MTFRARYHRNSAWSAIILAIVAATGVVGCGGGGGSSAPASIAGATLPLTAQLTASPSPAASATAASSTTSTRRPQFLGAFFRPEGSPPFGVFSATLSSLKPVPYPTPGTTLLGSSGYCTRVVANGVSIESGSPVDPIKLSNIVNLGVRWVRMPAPQFTDDLSHVFGAGQYLFADFDSAQCNTLAEHRITPIVGLEAGPVQYASSPSQLPAQTITTYQTAADFGTWCGAVAAHERQTFSAVTNFSLPGNEVNNNPQLFPGGLTQIAAYSTACYGAIKAANPAAFVYGFELSMDGQANANGFVQQMNALGCGVGTCYDGLAIHFSLRYPKPAASTPCYPNPGGDYVMQCIADLQSAARSPVHVLVSETEYPVPGAVPDEASKALAVVAEFNTLAADISIDGASYADVDECGLYPTGYFANGCLISLTGQQLPAYTALQQLAAANYQ